jgi:hypothetical protein
MKMKEPQTRKPNPKRVPISDDEYAQCKTGLEQLSQKLSYQGTPEHKQTPGDFGLTPPCDPRPGKTYCDKAGTFNQKIALDLLREGFRRGLIDKRSNNDNLPRHVWAVMNGHVLEGKPSSSGFNAYHGYPMQQDDPLREKILTLWVRREV